MLPYETQPIFHYDERIPYGMIINPGLAGTPVPNFTGVLVYKCVLGHQYGTTPRAKWDPGSKYMAGIRLFVAGTRGVLPLVET